MRNKLKKIYGRLAAMLLIVGLILTVLPAAATAQVGTNLCAGFDPTFEKQTATTITGGAFTGTPSVADGGHGGNGVHDPNGKSLKLSVVGDGIYFRVPAKSQTNYTFSFWMKNSKKDALEMTNGTNIYYTNYNNITFAASGNWSDEMKSNIDWSYPNITNQLNKFERDVKKNDYQNLFFTFGAERTGEDINVWRQVKINFTTPYAYVGSVKLGLSAKCDDEHLAIDDISVVETGFAANEIFNGNLEAIRYDREVPELSTLKVDGLGGNEVSIVTDPDDPTNHVYKIYSPEKNETLGDTSLFVSNSGFFPRGKNLGTKYKLSFRSKTSDGVNLAIRMRNIGVTNSNYADFRFGGKTSAEWRTHTLYIDATKAAKAGKLFTNRALYFGKTLILKGQTAYIDDLYSWYDKSSIGFYKTLNFDYDTTNGDRYLDYKDTEYKGNASDLTNIVMQETSIEAKNIGLLPQNDDGSRTVTVRAHYLPKPTWGTENGATTVSFDATEVTLLSAVYAYATDEQDKIIENSKKLVSVDIDSATSSVNGETIDVVGEVSVPAEKDGVTYQVEGMAWDINSMKPILDKVTLTW